MSRALVVISAVLQVAATLSAYAWRALFDSDQFANRATAALQDRSVREAIADRVTDELLVPARPELLAARPLVTSVVAGAVGGDAFASLFRRAVRDVHAAVFRSEQDTVTLTLADVAIVVAAAVRHVDPELAAEIEPRTRVALLEGDFGATTGDVVRLARRLRVLAFVLAGLALAAAAGALALSGDRRRTAAQLGLAMVVAGVAIAATDIIVRGLVLDLVDDRAVVGAVWDAFLGDLRTVGWLVAGVGAIVAAAAASLVRPVEVEQPLRWAWRAVTTEPSAVALRIVRDVAVAAAGVLVIAEPLAVLRIAAALAGVYALYKGLETLLRLTYRPRERAPRPRRRAAVPLVAVALIAAAVAVFLDGGGVEEPARAIAGCNGHAALCDRPLNHVTLPTTHNSMSVPLPGCVCVAAGAPDRRPARRRHPGAAARHPLCRPAPERPHAHILRQRRRLPPRDQAGRRQRAERAGGEAAARAARVPRRR